MMVFTTKLLEIISEFIKKKYKIQGHYFKISHISIFTERKAFQQTVLKQLYGHIQKERGFSTFSPHTQKLTLIDHRTNIRAKTL